MPHVQYGMLPQTKESLSHILKHYELYKKDRKSRGLNSQPMMVGVSGCQGSGKTTLCDTLAHLLKEEPYNLNVANFSLDDVYLTHQDQVGLSKKYPNNPLYQQRGQAGSHDLKLARQTFKSLISNQQFIPIPAYDKSLHEGQGDRLDKSFWKQVTGPFDIVLFEGWMLGFKPLLSNIMQQRCITGCSIQDAQVMNEQLGQYEDELYPFFDIFIHLSPAKLDQVYQWRLQQEHHMKASRGVKGLSDEQVKNFVDTYMPAYQLYLPRLDKVGFFGQGLQGEKLKLYEGLKRLDKGYSESSRHLRIVLDGDRRVIKSEAIKETITTTLTKATPHSNNYTLFNKAFMYRCAFIGVLGIIGYKRKSIIDTFFRLSKRFNST